MADFDKREKNGLSEIDELLELMEEDMITDDDIPDEDYEPEYEDDNESDDTESPVEAFISKVKDVYDDIAEKTYQIYTDPAEKTLVTSKFSIITIASCTVAFIIIAVAAYFFLTSFNYYTTGVTVDEFIERFNNVELTSDSDIYQIIPSYTDVLISEDAKLSGDNTIELMDGHVVIEANTRFGKIVDLTVKNVDYPGYNADKYMFEASQEDPYYPYYYYVCLGKIVAAFHPEINTVFDATNIAYQMHYNSYKYYSSYGLENFGVEVIEVNDNLITYDLVDACLTVEPVQRTITSAEWPDWLKSDETE